MAAGSGPSASAAARSRGIALTALAGTLYSTAGLFTRAVQVDGWTILAWRGLFGAIFLLFLALGEPREGAARRFALGREQAVLVPVTALGTMCYTFALKLTTVADVMVVYATTPFVTAAVAWLWKGERPTARLLRASGIALAGVAIMIGDVGFGGRLLGAALTLVMNVTFAFGLVQANTRPGSMTIVNGLGVLLASVVAFALAPAEPIGARAFVILAAFGLLTLGLAMALFMAGARRLPAAEVGLIGIVDVAIGPALVWLVYREEPGMPATIGGALVMGAVLWHLWPDLRRASARV